MAILPNCRSWWYRCHIHLPTLGTLVQRGHSWEGGGVLISSIVLSNNKCQGDQNLPGQQFNHVSGLYDDIRIPAFPEIDSLWNSLILIWTPKPLVLKRRKVLTWWWARSCCPRSDPDLPSTCTRPAWPAQCTCPRWPHNRREHDVFQSSTEAKSA